MSAVIDNKTRKINILYLITNLGTGGAQMMLYRLLSRLDRTAFEPQVMILLADKGLIRPKIVDIGIPVHEIGLKSTTSLLPLLRMYRLIKSAKPDIVHTQLFAADILGRIICRILRVPVVITSIRNTTYGGKTRDLLIKLTEKYAAKTTIVSRVAAKRFIDHKIIAAEKLQVIYNGLDSVDFYTDVSPVLKKKIRSEKKLPSDQFLLLAVGRLTEQKGYPYLLEAFRLLAFKFDNVSLIFAGSGELEEDLKRRVQKLGLNGRVLFLGRVSEIPKLMAAADLLVSSSLWEGLPGVVMEAMASELPIVATSVGGTPELVEQAVCGYLVPPGDAGALAAALEEVILLPVERRKTMGEAGRKIIEEKFRIDFMVEAYEKLYRDSLKEIKLS